MRVLCTLLVLSILARATEPAKEDRRNLTAWLPVDLPLRSLELEDEVKLAEGPRGMRDSFPFLVAVRRPKADQAFGDVLTPKNVAHFLKKVDGKAIRTQRQAFEVVRLFVPGLLVADAAAAERVVKAAQGLPGVKVHDYRPPVYAPLMARDGDGWLVSFAALELVGRARLVAVEARIGAKEEIAIRTKPIVDGPQLSWQVGFAGEPTSEQLENEKRARERAQATLRSYLAALQAKPGVDHAWALARGVGERALVEAAIGKPAREWGVQVTMAQYVLPDKSTLTFGYPAGGTSIRHVGRLWSKREGDARLTFVETYRSTKG